MRRALYKALLAAALIGAAATVPGCAGPGVSPPAAINPMSAAQALDQRAYALLNTYAAIIEEATEVVRDPDVPMAFKRALGQAERVATPAAETLGIAVAAYAAAQAEFQAASSESQPVLERAATGLAIAARQLNSAVLAAQAPIDELEQLVRAHRG